MCCVVVLAEVNVTVTDSTFGACGVRTPLRVTTVLLIAPAER